MIRKLCTKKLKAITVFKKERGGLAQYDHYHRLNGFFYGHKDERKRGQQNKGTEGKGTKEQRGKIIKYHYIVVLHFKDVYVLFNKRNTDV